jgi:hypothetical protein
VKRLAVIGLISIYLLGALGLQLQMQFCCGHLTAVNLTPEANCNKDSTCCNHQQCCSSILIDSEVDDAHFASFFSPSIDNHLPIIAATGLSGELYCDCSTIHTFSRSYNKPPPKTTAEILALHQDWQFDSEC